MPIARVFDDRRQRLTAIALFVGLVLIYNANGREIGSYDSQPTKFTIRELAVGGTLTLDRLVAEQPVFAERAGFARDRQGHYRSAYSMVPVLAAALPAIVLQRIGAIDMDAPLAPNLAAAVTASTMTAAAVVLVYLSLLRLVAPSIALWTAIGLGVGTNYWALVSQTLWQHESVALGLAIALWAWLRPIRRSDRHAKATAVRRSFMRRRKTAGSIASATRRRPRSGPACWRSERWGWRWPALPVPWWRP